MLVVVDYEAGNLHSVGRALRHLDVDFRFSGEPEVVARADRVILPGVGSAAAAMRSLRRRGLDEVLRNFERPLLGICLGMQLLYQRSEEESCRCLGLLEGSVRRFDSGQVKVPHVGWNRVSRRGRAERWFGGVADASYFYFVHSYFAPADGEDVVATTDYAGPFCSAAARGPLAGVQFHPELSGADGLRLLENFACS